MNEEQLAFALPDRRERGRYFTPAALADYVIERAARLCPNGRVAVVDPACGAGAFLAAAARHLPDAELFGLELSERAAADCRARLPRATIRVGDALRGDLDRLLARVPETAFQLWVGNPPYNGTSPLLSDKEAYARVQSLLPGALPRGTSLRDDYAFFLLLALAHRPGAIAFVTSATLIDAFLYSPLRRTLLDSLALREVVELGRGAFARTRVQTCVTIWAAPGEGVTSYRTRREAGPFNPSTLLPPVRFRPSEPEWLLRPPDREAAALDALWRETGEPLSTLVPITFPGLKTRFDELLVDEDRERLFERVTAFLACRGQRALARFAGEWSIPGSCWPKLVALHAASAGVEPNRRAIRPFYRYAGARHRGRIPEDARAFCYLDRQLIPRGDHRLRGPYDPHLCATKLIFNTRELPLAAAVLETPGCVHDHRHARFAPLFVPARLRQEGLGAARRGALGPDEINLSDRGRRWAERLGGPAQAFEAIARFINSEAVQKTWGPAYGTSRELCVPMS